MCFSIAFPQNRICTFLFFGFEVLACFIPDVPIMSAIISLPPHRPLHIPPTGAGSIPTNETNNFPTPSRSHDTRVMYINVIHHPQHRNMKHDDKPRISRNRIQNHPIE
jgi:hypothetical protein